jgi:hypothetical protein
MPIPLSAPIVETKLVATPVAYDSVWITRLEVTGSPTVPTAVLAIFQSWNTQTNELGESSRRLDIPDLFAAAANDPELAQTVNSLMGVLVRLAKAHGVLP